jgi:hypothetical protein
MTTGVPTGGRRVLLGFELTDFGAVIGYATEPDDVRKSGNVVAQHQLAVKGSDPDYADALLDIKDAVLHLLEDALEDFHSTPPHVDEDEEDVDEDAGMGDG